MVAPQHGTAEFCKVASKNVCEIEPIGLVVINDIDAFEFEIEREACRRRTLPRVGRTDAEKRVDVGICTAQHCGVLAQRQAVAHRRRADLHDSRFVGNRNFGSGNIRVVGPDNRQDAVVGDQRADVARSLLRIMHALLRVVERLHGEGEAARDALGVRAVDREFDAVERAGADRGVGPGER